MTELKKTSPKLSSIYGTKMLSLKGLHISFTYCSINTIKSAPLLRVDPVYEYFLSHFQIRAEKAKLEVSKVSFKKSFENVKTKVSAYMPSQENRQKIQNGRV